MGALALCGAAALASALSPVAAGIVLASIVLGVLVLVVPLWTFIPGVLLAVIVAAQIETQAGTGTLPLTYVGAVLAMLMVLRSVLARESLRIPLAVWLTTGIFAGSIILATLVAYMVSPGWPSGGGLATGAESLLDQLQKQLLYIAAGVTIGLIAGADEGGRLRTFRGIAWVTVIAGIGSALYWAWASEFIGIVGPLEPMFESTRLWMIENSLPRLRSGFPFRDNPNTQAVLFAALAGLVTPVLVAARRRTDRVLAILTLASAAAGVLSTQSRTGIILLGIVALGIAVATSRSSRSRGIMVLSVIAVATAVIFIFVALPESRQFNDTGTFESRVVVWETLLGDLANSPIIGHGFRYGVIGTAGESSHSEYLSRFVEGGTIGGLVFLFTLGMFVRVGWLQYTAGLNRAAGVGMMTFMAVIGVGMAVLTSWTSGGPTMLLSWMFFGLFGAMSTVTPETSPADPQPR